MYVYKKGLKWTAVKIGVMITAALLLLVTAVLFIGNISKLYTSEIQLYAVYDDVRGLRTGAPVRFSGVEVGTVEDLEFKKQGSQVSVKMAIDKEPLDYLKEDSEALILTFGLLGDKYVEITAGSASAGNLSAGDVIRGKAPTELRDIIDASKGSIQQMTEIVSALRRTLEGTNVKEGTLVKLLTDPVFYTNLKHGSEQLSNVLARINSGEGTLGKLIYDGQLYNQFDQSAKNLKEFSETLHSEGTLYHLIQNPKAYRLLEEDLVLIGDFFREVSTASGTLDRLIHDQQLYHNLNSTTTNLDGLIQNFETDPGRYLHFSLF